MTSLLLIALAIGQPDPAREAVNTTVETARKRDWSAYAKSLAPDDLKSFRADWVPLLEGLKKAEADNQKGFLEMFPGVKDVDGVLKLRPEEFLAKIMAGTDKGQLFRGPQTEKTEVLGIVSEGDGQSHVVVRATRKWADKEHSVVEVMTVRKVNGAWKTELPQVLKQLGVAMRASYSAKPGTATAKDEAKPEPPLPKK